MLIFSISIARFLNKVSRTIFNYKLQTHLDRPTKTCIFAHHPIFYTNLQYFYRNFRYILSNFSRMTQLSSIIKAHAHIRILSVNFFQCKNKAAVNLYIVTFKLRRFFNKDKPEFQRHPSHHCLIYMPGKATA